MENSSKEVRRKRIIEGGSDRVDLITGRIGSLPPSTSSSSPTHHSYIESPSPPTLFSLDDQPNHRVNVGPEGEDNDASGSTSILPKTVRFEESRNRNAFDFGRQVEPQFRMGEASKEAKQKQDQPSASEIKKPSTDIATLPKLQGHARNSLTPKQVSSSIMASETTRIICSLMIALMVVLSYVDRPLLGRNLVKSKSVVALRPLYILLLTDVTIVLSRLFYERREGLKKAQAEEEEEEDRAAIQEDGHNWTGAVKVLETGLVVYQSICAVFFDFCVYAVVVICGLSFV